ncbi:hypothetical protein PIB30_032481 [Stylosanthes scabra]|uniref:Uncharacterized protein n=1 Tax=Stylosanthes scabra TaxID=79078 RepID=A0ABU6UAX2_9FABA|nr:hypothetical protein [Stylosanthes scabra]
MSRSKKTTSKRQRQSDDIVYTEPSTEHQFARYFSRLDDLNHYVFNFHDRKEIPPRYLDIKILETQNFNVLRSILTSQGLLDFVQIRESYYPELVAMAYSTLSIEFNEECPTKFTLKFRLFKNEYEVNSGILSTLWSFDDLDTSNCVLIDGNKTPESWGPHVKKQAFEMFNIQRAPKNKILCNVFNLEMRVLHYLLTYVIFPRSTGHTHVQVDDLVIMWAMNNDIKIHWPYFIIHHMLRFTKNDHGKGIGYVYLWTRIFKHLGIDFSNESRRLLAQQHVIDIRALHHMSSNVQREEEAQEPPPQAQEDQAGPSEKPSMSDLMRVLQNMEQNMNQRFKGIEDNQAHLDQQIQNLQQEQRRIWRSVRRVEAWTFDEDWNIPSEDEDQD